MLLLIDNYDSFTYNLAQYFMQLGQNVQVVYNDAISIETIWKNPPTHIVISPGPCTPNESGISLEIIARFAGKIPILGVCLGHEAIGQYYGGKIIHAKTTMHGKVSKIFHKNRGIFENIPSPYIAARYHSLVIDQNSLPACLEITAWTQDENGNIDEIMGIKHKEHALEGVQFHPEAILTEHGHKLLHNFLLHY